ncbi:DUF7878 domain-containing protein [Alkalicoccobacillus murimartini]|uniref:DUF7878 domain-containing protein n=1 Tax=Alkalicoccobacillus murimartini TaxID=171685 RepID=A0ABT9YIR7_9BACI|nr:hypothetical protein [Alkalicoccobacillus murimartini]MDQ0207421.1 hypothetical protein [Alkalicoccobacillus murimartini]
MNEYPKVKYGFTFTSTPDAISRQKRKDVPTILSVEATFSIWINDDLYVRVEEMAILEFYKSLAKWVQANQKYKRIQEFHYFTIEHDEREGAIISLLPFGDKARLKTIWPEQELYNVFELKYIVEQLTIVEADLRKEIEHYFDINLTHFMNHIPYRIAEWRA